MCYIKIFFCFVLLASVNEASGNWIAKIKQFFTNLVQSKNTNEYTPEESDLTEDVCDVVGPDKPNFLIPGRGISASKCAEFHWIMTQNEIQRKNLDKCSQYLQKNTQNEAVLHFFKAANTPIIFGGIPAEAGEFPHMGAIGWKSKDTAKRWVVKCGSTLISENFVLTAGHCTKVPLSSTQDIDDPIPKVVRFGTENRSIEDDSYSKKSSYKDVDVKRIIIHPDFKPPNRYNDIALMELEQNVQFDLNVMPACLWNKMDIKSLGDRVAVTGWGYTEKGSMSDKLLVAYVDILNTTLCDELLFTRRGRHWQGFADTQICAGNLTGGVDTCQGDSGGPIQVKMERGNNTEGYMNMVLGVTSFGVSCAKRNLPGIYTRVSSFVPWIESVVWGDLLNNTEGLNTPR